MRLISTTSSATRRWPRSIRSSAHSDLPMPLSPRISTPSPKTSSSTECRCSRVASRSSRKADSSLMKAVDSSGVVSTGMPRASAARQQLGRRHQPLGHDEAGDAAAAQLVQDRRAAARPQLAQVADLAAADDLHAAVADVVGVARERQARPLHARQVDAVVEPGPAGREVELQRLRGLVEQLGDHDAGAFGLRLRRGTGRGAAASRAGIRPRAR